MEVRSIQMLMMGPFFALQRAMNERFLLLSLTLLLSSACAAEIDSPSPSDEKSDVIGNDQEDSPCVFDFECSQDDLLVCRPNFTREHFCQPLGQNGNECLFDSDCDMGMLCHSGYLSCKPGKAERCTFDFQCTGEDEHCRPGYDSSAGMSKLCQLGVAALGESCRFDEDCDEAQGHSCIGWTPGVEWGNCGFAQ